MKDEIIWQHFTAFGRSPRVEAGRTVRICVARSKETIGLLLKRLSFLFDRNGTSLSECLVVLLAYGTLVCHMCAKRRALIDLSQVEKFWISTLSWAFMANDAFQLPSSLGLHFS